MYPPYVKGGAELSAHYLAQGLQQRGHEVRVISSSRDRRIESVVDGVVVTRVPSSFTAKPLFEQTWARRQAKIVEEEITRQGSFDIIHCHDFRTAQVMSQMNIPNVFVTVRDYAFICGSPNNILADGSLCPGCERLANVLKNRAVVEAPRGRRIARIWQYWHNISFRKSTLAHFKRRIYISAAQQAIYRERLGDGSAQERVIYNPVPPSYFSVRPVETVGRLILYVGIVESYKGVGLLLDAFAALHQAWPDVHLKIAGEGAQRKFYEAQVARWGLQYHASFVGRVPIERLRRLFDEASVVVAPHIWPEPFGRVVVEAMARERLVVAAQIGGPAEIIQDGVTGFLFKPNSQEALQAALARALSTRKFDRREIERAARQWCARHLTVDLIARAHEEFYSDCREQPPELKQ